MTRRRIGGWPEWLRAAVARLPPIPLPITILTLGEYLPQFGGRDDGPSVTWMPEAK